MAAKSLIRYIKKTTKKSTQPIGTFIASQSPARLFLIASLLLTGFLLFGLAITILANVLLFDGVASNGAFQLMNPLRRLAEGELIGRDFNFFHGIGVPLLHAPFYYLFGQGLLGSELARWIVSPGIFVATTFCFFYVFKRSKLFAFNMTAAVTAIAMLLISSLVLPLTSLLGVRSAVPVLLMVLMLKQERFRKPLVKNVRLLRSLTVYEFLVGLILAVSFICGTEFGAAAIVAYLITHFAYRLDKRPLKEYVLSALRIMGSLIVMLLALLGIISGGSPMQALAYALGDIPADQFWYFGVPPNNFLHGGNIIEVFVNDGRLLAMWAVALVAGFLVYKVHKLKTHRMMTQAFIFGLLAGFFAMVSMLGYYNNTEASALARMALLVGGASIVILWGAWKKPLKGKFELGTVKRKINIGPQQLLQFLAYFAIIAAIVNAFAVVALLTKDYDVKRVLGKSKAFVTGVDTSILGSEWHAVDSAIMPVIQQDNAVSIVDVNDDEFSHGISTKTAKLVVASGDKASFVRPGQIVYLAKSGRQIIKQVEAKGDQQIVTLQNPGLRLDPQYDGNPAKLVVAEDFEHNNKKLWSVYSGLIEEEMGIMNATPQGYDYIIHALGEKRRAEYVHDFATTQPEFVLTLTRPYFRYEEWMQNAHWDFYDLLDKNYQLVKETSIYNVWKKRPQSWVSTGQTAESWQPLIVDGTDKIALPAVSFDNVPDLASYAKQGIQQEQDRLKQLGLPVMEQNLLNNEQYNAFRIEQENAKRQQELMERENSGYETDMLEHKAWLQEVEAARLEEESRAKNSTKPELIAERPKRQVILVKLQYEISHPLSGIPIFGKTNRFLIEPNNTFTSTPVSLRPYAKEVIFPIVLSEKNKDPYLRLNSYSILPGKGKIAITKAEWMPLETSVVNLKAFTE